MFKKIFFSFSIYSITSIICALLGILILPILTKHLSERDYGLTALFSTYIAILSPIIGFSSSGYFWLEFFRKEQSRSNLTKIFSTYFWFVCAFSSFIIIILFVFFPFYKNISFFSIFFIFLIPATSFISVIGDETKSFFINNKKPIHYLIYSVLVTLIELCLSYYFIIYVFKDWKGRIVAWLISLFIQFLFTVWLFGVREKFIQFKFSRSILNKLLLFGYPLIFHQLGKYVINQSDRLFITKMISIDEAGIYSIGYQVGSMLLLPIAAFANFFTPFVYERLADINQTKKIEIVKTSYIFAGLIIFCYLSMICIAPYFFKLLIDEKFHKGITYVFWVGLGYVFWGLYMLFSTVIFFQQKTKFLGLLSILNMLLNAALNFLLIKHFGAIGAAYATTISFFVVFVITSIYSNNLYPMPWLFFIKSKVNRVDN
jgi:O-antigen/teichoic acid export membrane protein